MVNKWSTNGQQMVTKWSSTFINFLLISSTFMHFHPFSSTTSISPTFIHFHPFLSTSSIFTHFYPLSSAFIHFHLLHTCSPNFIHFHPLSSIFTHFHPFSSTDNHCDHTGPHLRDPVPMGTFFSFWVPISVPRSPFSLIRAKERMKSLYSHYLMLTIWLVVITQLALMNPMPVCQFWKRTISPPIGFISSN